MVITAKNFPKWTLIQNLHQLVPIVQMVSSGPVIGPIRVVQFFQKPFLFPTILPVVIDFFLILKLFSLISLEVGVGEVMEFFGSHFFMLFCLEAILVEIIVDAGTSVDVVEIRISPHLRGLSLVNLPEKFFFIKQILLLFLFLCRLKIWLKFAFSLFSSHFLFCCSLTNWCTSSVWRWFYVKRRVLFFWCDGRFIGRRCA